MMPAPFTPRPYQRAMIDHVLETGRGALWAGMGLGKTSATLAALDALQLVEPEPALVLAPLRVATSTWPDEARKWSTFRHIEIAAVVGTPAQRRAALARPASVYTTNYENAEWLVAELGDRWPFATVIADESTRLKSFRLSGGGVRARALGKVAHSKVRRWVNLTGTPSPNGLLDLWGQQWFIDQGSALGRTFGTFKNRWFTPVPTGGGFFKYVAQRNAREEIEKALRGSCLSLEARDHFELPELVENTIYVDLPPKARRVYRALERTMYAELESTSVEAFNAAALTLKCLQLANGAAYVDGGESWVDVHDAKLAALDSVIEEAAGEPVLVAYHFRSDLARILKAFPRARVLDKDPATIRDWNLGLIPILVAHPESAGHGLNLQDGGRTLAFFGHWWSLEPWLQIIERIGPTRQAQAGHARTVHVHYIVARDTVDELVVERRKSKETVQALLMGAMKNGRR